VLPAAADANVEGAISLLNGSNGRGSGQSCSDSRDNCCELRGLGCETVMRVQGVYDGLHGGFACSKGAKRIPCAIVSDILQRNSRRGAPPYGIGSLQLRGAGRAHGRSSSASRVERTAHSHNVQSLNDVFTFPLRNHHTSLVLFVFTSYVT